jgi:hypothetical protein
MSTTTHNKPLTISKSILVTVSCISMSLFSGFSHAETLQTPTNKAKVITPGDNNPEVQVIQVQLKALGYNTAINGAYDSTTQQALAKFQKDVGLKKTDGIINQPTRISLQKVLDGKTKIVITKNDIKSTIPTVTKPKNDDHYLLWSRLLNLGSFAVLGFALYISYQEKKSKSTLEPTSIQPKLLTQIPILISSPETEILTSVEMSPMPKLNLADELMENLNSLDPVKQRQAIWNLSQTGDSRAIEPLMNLLIDADSQKHSLILSALADISIRSLKPIRKALVMSVQNENSEVRQNAIRDLARVYDIISQINQTIYLSLSDQDPEVQATAKYALKKMNGITEKYHAENSLPDERIEVLTHY